MEAVRNRISKQEVMRLFDRCNSLVNLVVGAANSMAGSALADAVDAARHSKYYKHEAKRELNMAVKCFEQYEHMHHSNFGDRYRLFLDYLDATDDALRKHVGIFRMSLMQVMTRNNVEDADIKAYMETARCMAALACTTYDNVVEGMEKRACHAANFKAAFSPARLTNVLFHLDRASKIIVVHNGSDVVDLNGDPNCSLAMEIIQKKLSSEDTLNRAGYIAIKENPDCAKYMSDEDMKILEKYIED